ncbi:MAG TPA: SPFH domain-containing protein, partial [Gemmatimonadaceae bacterium]|nr:SPFH domain-containing protein [Gemmatimonadaceae bacterium]
IIEWTDVSDEAMAWHFARPDNEIKNGAQLIVRPAQVAILVDQGTIADIFQPGRHDLTTANMPLLSRLRGWKYGFESPFKADVIFLSTRQFVDRKWGTAHPVILRDEELGPVRLRAFGTYAVRIVDAAKFVTELSGATSAFAIDQIAAQLRDMVVAKVSAVLADDGISIYELAAKYAQVGARVQERVAPQFEQYGLSITQLVIENVSLPSEVEATLDQKTRLSMLHGELDSYAQLQSADAIREAARNPSGGAAAGVGIGMGAALGQRAMAAAPSAPSIATASAAPVTPAVAAAAAAGASAAGSFEPPPLPTALWYYAVGNERKGPVDEATLGSLGALTAETLVWKHGMAGWAPAASVPELATLIQRGR